MFTWSIQVCERDLFKSNAGSRILEYCGKAHEKRDLNLEFSRVFKDADATYSSQIQKNRPDSNSLFPATILNSLF